MSFEIPDDCRYLESHEWARTENGTVRVAHLGQFHEHHVAEFVLREVGDADADGSVLGAGPLV